MSFVDVRLEDHVATVTLNRPEALNAISGEVADELAGALLQAAARPDAWVVVLAAAGDRAFCVGADLKERNRLDDAGWLRNRMLHARDVRLAPRRCPSPTIASVFGFALGGGFELALVLRPDRGGRRRGVRAPRGHASASCPAAGRPSCWRGRSAWRRAKELIFTGRRDRGRGRRDAWGSWPRVVPRAERSRTRRPSWRGDLPSVARWPSARPSEPIDRGVRPPARHGIELEDLAWRRAVASRGPARGHRGVQREARPRVEGPVTRPALPASGHHPRGRAPRRAPGRGAAPGRSARVRLIDALVGDRRAEDRGGVVRLAEGASRRWPTRRTSGRGSERAPGVALLGAGAEPPRRRGGRGGRRVRRRCRRSSPRPTATTGTTSASRSRSRWRDVARRDRGGQRRRASRSRSRISAAFGDPYEGDVAPERVVDAGRAARSSWAPPASRSGDTTGMATPTRVWDAAWRASASRSRACALNLHFHDTRGTAMANVLAALQAGVTEFDASVGGLGGSPFAPGRERQRGHRGSGQPCCTTWESRPAWTSTRLAAAARLAGELVGRELPGHLGRAPAQDDGLDVRTRADREPGRDRRARDPHLSGARYPTVAVHSDVDAGALHVGRRRGRPPARRRARRDLPGPRRHRRCSPATRRRSGPPGLRVPLRARRRGRGRSVPGSSSGSDRRPTLSARRATSFRPVAWPRMPACPWSQERSSRAGSPSRRRCVRRAGSAIRSRSRPSPAAAAGGSGWPRTPTTCRRRSRRVAGGDR